jgi:cytochrome b6-f complex subunit 5
MAGWTIWPFIVTPLAEGSPREDDPAQRVAIGLELVGEHGVKAWEDCGAKAFPCVPMIEPLLCGIVLGLIPVTLLGLFVAAWNQYRRGSVLDA